MPLAEAIHFLALLLIALAMLKVSASYFLHRNAQSSVGHAIDWFLTPA
jgi:hypothetical protein